MFFLSDLRHSCTEVELVAAVVAVVVVVDGVGVVAAVGERGADTVAASAATQRPAAERLSTLD